MTINLAKVTCSSISCDGISIQSRRRSIQSPSKTNWIRRAPLTITCASISCNSIIIQSRRSSIQSPSNRIFFKTWNGTMRRVCWTLRGVSRCSSCSSISCDGISIQSRRRFDSVTKQTNWIRRAPLTITCASISCDGISIQSRRSSIQSPSKDDNVKSYRKAFWVKSLFEMFSAYDIQGSALVLWKPCRWHLYPALPSKAYDDKRSEHASDQNRIVLTSFLDLRTWALEHLISKFATRWLTWWKAIIVIACFTRIWLILPVVICLLQGLSHASVE